ncbi:MAG TPA: hypothetical protein VFI27_14765 [candidate division Zixibacteria bacterium]|nr:hypothetical protein [candidate division Zixibacteria bacterium]
MNGRRARLAWLLLLGGFSLCVGITIAVPIAVGRFIQSSTRSLTVEVQANQGTVGLVLGDNETGALFAGDPAQTLNPNGSIITNATDQALLLVSTPDGDQLMARAQIYGNTTIAVERAAAPRFSSSSSVNTLNIVLTGGRLLLTIPRLEEISLNVGIEFPQGKTIIQEPGLYSILATNSETQFAVLQGEAEVVTEDDQLTLSLDQRAIIPTGSGMVGPLDSERNIVTNGDFVNGFDEWVVITPNLELPDQPTVEIKIDNLDGEPILNFRRLGIGHADSGIRQIVDQDVTDFDDLRLALSMRISEQSLGVCGEQGSECPLFVRIDYEDVNGVDQTWLQGFYAQGTTGQNTPDVCVACPPPLNEHYRIPFGQLGFYESDNLLEKLGLQGILPRRIKSLTLIASGHTFDTEVVDVALLANE